MYKKTFVMFSIQSTALLAHDSTRLGSRVLARRVMSRGIFRDAVVVRGADWRWEDQDGEPAALV